MQDHPPAGAYQSRREKSPESPQEGWVLPEGHSEVLTPGSRLRSFAGRFEQFPASGVRVRDDGRSGLRFYGEKTKLADPVCGEFLKILVSRHSFMEVHCGVRAVQSPLLALSRSSLGAALS